MSGLAQDGGISDGRRPIVVGVDGSDCSLAALRWAVEQARVTQQPLRAITTWQWPNLYGNVVVLPSEVNLELNAREVLDKSLERVLGADVGDVESFVVEGHPSVVLEEQSGRASLLVVGSRGHGEFVGMLIGSVSEFLATHASCPVVIVRCPLT